jgi:hypothetical protein
MIPATSPKAVIDPTATSASRWSMACGSAQPSARRLRLWDVFESYLSLIADPMSDATSAFNARECCDQLEQVARTAYADVPRTKFKGYGRTGLMPTKS